MAKFIQIDESLKSLIPKYLESRKIEISLLESYLEKNDFESIQTIAHNWTGVAPSYGFVELGDIGCQMEMNSKNKDYHEIQKQIKSAQNYLDSILIEYITPTNNE